MDTLKLLLTNSKFWFAVFGLVHAILLYFYPTFPKEIWAGVDVLFTVIVGVICVDDIKSKVKELRG